MRVQATIAALFLVVSACSPEDVKQLGNGYTLEAMDPDNHAIVHGTYVVVSPDVVDCTTQREYVVCQRREPVGLNDPRFFDEPFGWLILNTRSGELNQGLNRSALKEILKKKNISLN